MALIILEGITCFCVDFVEDVIMITNFCRIGHSAVLHGCTVEDEAFVGMGATLLDGVYVEKHAMVAAGALVRQNTRIPCGEVCIFSISNLISSCLSTIPINFLRKRKCLL